MGSIRDNPTTEHAPDQLSDACAAPAALPTLPESSRVQSETLKASHSYLVP